MCTSRFPINCVDWYVKLERVLLSKNNIFIIEKLNSSQNDQQTNQSHKVKTHN